MALQVQLLLHRNQAVTAKIYPNMRRPLLFLYLEAPKLGRSSGVTEHLWLKARH